MNNETIFKGHIKSIDSIANKFGIKTNVMFRIVNFNNLFFFAEEISTGCIFPIYSPTFNGDFIINNSFIYRGKYFIYFPLKNTELFQFTFNDDELHCENIKNISIPLISQIKEYLEDKEENMEWLDYIKSMEVSNKYLCDLESIKEEINKLKSKDLIEPLNIKPNYFSYKPKVDISEIKELGYDLSMQEDLCNLIGREEEIKKIIKAIAIKGKSVILLGDPGVGKTSIPEKLALDIKMGKSKFLNDKMIFCLNIGNLVAGTKYRGDFEKKLQTLIDFCKENKGKIILFIDEIHTLYGLGSSEGSTIDAVNMLKPYISSGDLTIIGATTKAEYEKYMAKDPAFLRRFENIEISSPTKEMVIEILLASIKELEEKYNIKLKLTNKEKIELVNHIFAVTDGKCGYIAGNIKIENPTLAKNVLENAFTEAIYNEKTFVSRSDVDISIKEYDKLSLEFISEFGYDLSKQANLCNLVGREKELTEIIKALAIEQNSVLLVGEPGTGKTSLVEKIAIDIKNNNCEFLKNKTIFYLNTASLTAGTSLHGEFEEKLNKLINSCRKSKGKIILFIDEIHNLYGLGRTTNSSIDAMNILKPFISNGDLTIIGATTNDEYKKYMSNDPAFLRRFKKIDIAPLSKEEKIQILVSFAKDLESKYNIKIKINSISLNQLMEFISEITDPKHQTVKNDVKVENPTISKFLLETAFSDALYNKKDCVTINDIYMAILNCDKLPACFRKDCAEVLKEFLKETGINENSDLLEYSNKKLQLTNRTPVRVGFVQN